jgi:hypothetical protein
MRIKAPGKYPNEFYCTLDRWKPKSGGTLMWAVRPTYKKLLRKIIRRNNKLIFLDEVDF